MKRRQFLTIGGAGGGACFFAGDLFRRFQDYVDNHGVPLLEKTPRKAGRTLYVEPAYGMIALDAPVWSVEDPACLTWGQYLDLRRGYVPNCEEGWREARDHIGLLPPPSFDRLRKELAKKGGYRYEVNDLDEEIPADLHASYLQWEWVMTDSPESQAYHFLDDLDIGTLGPDPEVASAGELNFTEGTMPGNNSTMVSLRAMDREVAASCLQRRLNELVGDVEVIYG